MILLKNGTYIDWQTLAFLQVDILVEDGTDGKIIFVKDQPVGETVRVIDCRGKYITKAFANGHHHAYSALATGMPSPAITPRNFREILQFIWWNLDKALDPPIIRSSALVTAMACARNGVTFVVDHHASPMSIPGSLEIIAEAFDQVGISHLLCYEISDRDGMEKAEEGLEESARFLEKRQGLVGLHASFTIGEKTLRAAVDLARKFHSGIHIHTAEDRSDQDNCSQLYGKRVTERLLEAGALDMPKSILAHCLHIDDHERELVAGSPAWIAENMESNLNNGVGFFRSENLGRKIFLGTDGMHSNMLQSAKAAWFAGRHIDHTDPPEVYRRLRNIHAYLEQNSFKGDGENNLVLFDYNPSTPFETRNFYGHLFFGIESRHICHVISDGRLIVEERKILNVDEEEILAEARIQAKRLWERMK
jgi:cytosine/adenosine deaminase-related metal-dependent hydrolase